MILKQWEGNGMHSQTRQTHTGNIDGSYAPRHTPLVNFTIILCEAKCFHTLDFKFAGALTISLPLSGMFEMHQ